MRLFAFYAIVSHGFRAAAGLHGDCVSASEQVPWGRGVWHDGNREDTRQLLELQCAKS